MSFYNSFKKGNHFIFSPNGKITRIRFLIYALILDLIYKLIFLLSSYNGIEYSSIFSITGILCIPIIILKIFNYKKRIFSFINNTKYAYFYSILYTLIGGIIQEYSFYIQISNKKAIFEFTQDPLFQQYSNIVIPDFIGLDFTNGLFYIFIVLTFSMFITMISIPNIDKDSISTTQKFKPKTIVTPFIKNKIFNYRNFIPIAIIYLFFINLTYSEINYNAYNWMHYILNNDEIEYINDLNKFHYEQKLFEYSSNKKDCETCDRNDYFKYCVGIQEPEKPFFYKNDSKDITNYNKTLRRIDYDKFGCKESDFCLFNNKCGNLTFNKTNRYYTDFHPYILFIIAMILFLPISYYLWILLSIISIYLFNNLNNKFKSLKFKKTKKLNLSEKLENLKILKDKGLITEDDYNNKKQKLLDEF